MGFSQQEYWSGLPCPLPGDLPDPGIKSVSLMSPTLAGRFFTTEPKPSFRLLAFQAAARKATFSHLLASIIVPCCKSVGHFAWWRSYLSSLHSQGPQGLFLCSTYGLDHCREQVPYIFLSLLGCIVRFVVKKFILPCSPQELSEQVCKEFFLWISCAQNDKNSNVQTIFRKKKVFHKESIVEIYLLIGCHQISKSWLFRSHWPTNRTVYPNCNSTWYC